MTLVDETMMLPGILRPRPARVELPCWLRRERFRAHSPVVRARLLFVGQRFRLSYLFLGICIYHGHREKQAPENKS